MNARRITIGSTIIYALIVVASLAPTPAFAQNELIFIANNDAKLHVGDMTLDLAISVAIAP